MQITFFTRKFRNVERNLHCDVVHITTKWVSSLTLDCNGVFAIKAYDILFTQYLPDKIEDTMFLQPVTEEEIMQLVKNAKNKKSKDHDQFDMCLVKKIIPHIVKPLAHIFNISLMNGIFPDRMKIARVIRLFKNGDFKEFSNYRPVSIYYLSFSKY